MQSSSVGTDTGLPLDPMVSLGILRDSCQEIGLVAFMFFFELFFIFSCSSQFPSMFPLLIYSQPFFFLIC